jgi:hypothetical protein
LLILLVLLPAALRAQVGKLDYARILDEGAQDIGLNLIVPDIGILGSDRFGLSGPADIGVRAGFMRDSGVSRFQIAVDGRYGFLQASDGDPVDVDLVALFHLSTGQSITQWTFAVGPQLGATLPLSGSDVEISPYAGVLLGARHTGSGGGTEEIDGFVVQIPEGSSTDFGGLIPLGAQIGLGGDIDIFGEIDITVDGGTDAKAAFGAIYHYR